MNLEKVLPLLPRLLHESTEPHALEGFLSSLATALELPAIGIRWPLDRAASVVIAVGPCAANFDPIAIDSADIAKTLLSESLCFLANPVPRLFARVALSGRPSAMLWFEFPPKQSTTTAHQSVIQTIAQMLPASPLFTKRIGISIDQARLLQRIADSSIVCGRMAHDFDNILTGILGFTDLSLPMLPVGSQPHQYLTEVSKGGQRGIVFTQQLHQLSRSGQTKPMPSSVGTVLAMEETRLKPTFKPELRLQLDVSAELPPVAIEGGPLQNVISHILDNAVEASPQGGVIRVTGSVIELDQAGVESFLGNPMPGSFVELRIQDQGTGIKPEIRPRLFVEPFYTTKVRHRGLGLAIIFRILHAHKGGIQIESNGTPGSGTLVRLILPLAPKKSAAIR